MVIVRGSRGTNSRRWGIIERSSKRDDFANNLTKLHALSLAGWSERTECRTLRSLQTSFASSTITSSHMPSGVSSCFLRDLPPVSLILCFRSLTEFSPYLSYHSIIYHKSFYPFFHHSFFRRAQTS